MKILSRPRRRLRVRHGRATQRVSLGWAQTTLRGCFNPDGNLASRIGAFWFATATRVVLTESFNRDLFTKLTGRELNIGTPGDGLTVSQPAQFVVGNADQGEQ